MPMYEKNHYVPNLILKRYGEKITIYNLETKELLPPRNTRNCFFGKNIYPEEIEKMFQKVEGPFADLLAHKILCADKEVRLKRDDIDLIKKFLIILQLRAPFNFNENMKQRRITKERAALMGYKEVYIEGETEEEHNYRTMKVIIESSTLQDVFNHVEVTYEACFWALLYNGCYLTIWDSKESKEDFIITDIGMTCEHEYTKFLPISNFEELLKNGYLLSKIYDKNISDIEKNIYLQILDKTKNIYANYYMFSISETRMIGLINPFFRLYYDNDITNIPQPDIWPTSLSKDALKSNNVNYKNGILNKHKNDEYIYKIKNLKIDDVLIINSMMLDRVQKIFGYADTSKILRSLSLYSVLTNPINDYSDLQNKIINNGYNLPNPKKYQELADQLTLFKNKIKENDKKYIEFMLNH